MDAIAADGEGIHIEESKRLDNNISEGVVKVTPEVEKSDNADSISNQGITKDVDHETVANDTNISASNNKSLNHDAVESYSLVNAGDKTDSNVDDHAQSNKVSDKEADDNPNSETNTLVKSVDTSTQPPTKDAEDTEIVKDAIRDSVENDNGNTDSNMESDEPGELPETKTSITGDDDLNDTQIESSEISDGPQPTGASKSISDIVHAESVHKSPLEHTQSDSVISVDDKASTPKTDECFDERQNPEGSSNDSPRPSSPRDDVKDHDQKNFVHVVPQSQEETSEPKSGIVKTLDDTDGLKDNEEATYNERKKSTAEKTSIVNDDDGLITSSPVNSSEAVLKTSPESTEEQKDEVPASEEEQLTGKISDNTTELNSEITKNTDKAEFEQKQNKMEAQDNRKSDHDSPEERKGLPDVEQSKPVQENGGKDSDSVESNVAVVKPMMRTPSIDEGKQTTELETVSDLEEPSAQAEEELLGDHIDSNGDSEKAMDEPKSDVDTIKEQRGDEFSKGEVIPVGQPPLATHLQTGNSKSDHKTDTDLASETRELTVTDNDIIDPKNTNEVNNQSDNKLDNNRENNKTDPEDISNKIGDNEDNDEVKEQEVEVKNNDDANDLESTSHSEDKKVSPTVYTAEDTENKEVTPNDNVFECTSNNQVKEVTALHDEDTEINTNDNDNSVDSEKVKEEEVGDTNEENLKTSEEEKASVISERESHREDVKEAPIHPETAQKLGSLEQDEDQSAQIESLSDFNNENAPSIEPQSRERIEDQETKDEDEDPQKKISISSQTTEETDKKPEEEPVAEEVQKDDFTKWLLEEEAPKSEEKTDQRGQDRTPTPVRVPTPQPTTEELSTEEEYKEPTPEEKRADEIQNDKRGKDDDKVEPRDGTNHRGEDSLNKETNMPKEKELEKVEEKTDEQQEPPQTKRKPSVKQNGVNNQKPIGRKRTVRAPKPIQCDKPKEEQQRPVQRSKPVEANKPASRQRPITRERTEPPKGSNKGSTRSRPETTNGRMRHSSTSTNGRLLQRETTRTSQKSQRPKSKGVRDSSDGRAEQKEFFRKELTRIEEGLKKEVSKIQKPVQKKHTPFIFNDLKPYYDTSSQRYLIETPEELQHCSSSRTTAIGLIDPWKNLEMDKSVLPVLESKAVNRGETQKKKEKKIDERAKKTKHEGSTRLPKYPVVTLETSDLATKKLNYSDVPMLREELKQKYSANASKKIEEDYEKTKQDFYRMDLDKLNEVHPVNREHMRSTYFAYLQNTPGSKKAINECVKSIDNTEKAQ